MPLRISGGAYRSVQRRKDDWWLSDGFSRYSEAMYVENAAGAAGLEEAVKDMSVGALAYDTVPLSSASKLDMFSTEFQSLATDKGAMILHMLRWVLGEDKYNKTMRDFATEFAGKSASMDDFKAIAEKNYGEQLTWFFSQWLDSTGAPEFKVKYTTYRLGGNLPRNRRPSRRESPGFRVTGEISQDLDLFRMPVDLRIDTDGKTENKRIEVVGTTSPFSIETFGRPRRISVDPDHHVLTNSTDVKLRASILRGQAMQQQGDLSGALMEFNKALDLNKNSSLAHYRIAEVFFFQRNYQSSANAYRASIDGDGEPRWTEVWSRIQLGKIFDITGQRERAINEYRQATADQRQHLRRARRGSQISAESLRAAEGEAVTKSSVDLRGSPLGHGNEGGSRVEAAVVVRAWCTIYDANHPPCQTRVDPDSQCGNHWLKRSRFPVVSTVDAPTIAGRPVALDAQGKLLPWPMPDNIGYSYSSHVLSQWTILWDQYNRQRLHYFHCCFDFDRTTYELIPDQKWANSTGYLRAMMQGFIERLYPVHRRCADAYFPRRFRRLRTGEWPNAARTMRGRKCRIRRPIPARVTTAAGVRTGRTTSSRTWSAKTGTPICGCMK